MTDIVQGRIKVGLAVVMLALAALLVTAWLDAGIEPVRPMTAEATLPEAAR